MVWLVVAVYVVEWFGWLLLFMLLSGLVGCCCLCCWVVWLVVAVYVVEWFGWLLLFMLLGGLVGCCCLCC